MIKKPPKKIWHLWFYAQKPNQSKIWPYGSMVKKLKKPTKVKYGPMVLWSKSNQKPKARLST